MSNTKKVKKKTGKIDNKNLKIALQNVYLTGRVDATENCLKLMQKFFKEFPDKEVNLSTVTSIVSSQLLFEKSESEKRKSSVN